MRTQRSDRQPLFAAGIEPHSRRRLAAVGVLLLCVMAASLAGVGAGVHDLHRSVEIAQGEQPDG
ncbi:hypothetical protein OG936_34500 [Streptomyces sp. NBC_00846]|uniref:hypothetical protein n=1 Tax=Streptomyces sp. NBC_00846 TaxID=2975849 RepID=UPI00386D5F8D|nr:hypothetical protein OG936_34500 [Streptomyces sp. NBC_00846]